MTAHRRRFVPYLVAGLLFLSCLGLMSLMASAGRSPAPETLGTVERLSEPRVVEGVPCSGYVRLDAEGRLASCTLSEEHAFGPVRLPANTQVRRFRTDGTPKDVHLGRDTRFDGHLCRGDGPGGWMTGFYPDGRLEYCFLAERETIDGVVCEKGTFWGEITGGVITQFHPSGALKSCRLASSATVDGRTFRKKERIRLDPQGHVSPDSKAP